MKSVIIVAFFVVFSLALLDRASAKFCTKFNYHCPEKSNKLISSYKQAHNRMFELRKCERHCLSKKAHYVVFTPWACKCFATCKNKEFRTARRVSLLFPLGKDIDRLCG
ncbi:hypothetical protein TCAL_15498 [Tigriopus californicus]|uniref:Uncharacterized protein n=1 Tax=Tigriopus californicus TaxID=6832 RepID=A0A553PRW3_TIGCA|nr:hypothetical protein TCAL_15498 [Tigriopus californicus]